jgi:hypothetical protein
VILKCSTISWNTREERVATNAPVAHMNSVDNMHMKALLAQTVNGFWKNFQKARHAVFAIKMLMRHIFLVTGTGRQTNNERDIPFWGGVLNLSD